MAMVAGTALAERKTPLQGTPLERLFALAAESETIAVIVGVDVEGGWNVAHIRNPEKGTRQRGKARETKERILRKHPSARRVADRDFEFIPYYLLVVDATTLRHLVNDDDVVSIEENDAADRTLVESTAKIDSRAANLRGYTGVGTDVVVIDDGVRRDHPFIKHSMFDLKQSCFSGAQFAVNGVTPRSLCPGQQSSLPNWPGTVVNAAAPCSGCSHGTQVAGVIAGKSDSLQMYGVAPDTKLLPIQVYSYTNASCTYSGCPTEARKDDVLAALQHVHNRAPSDNFAAVNLSLKFRTEYSTRSACISDNLSVQNALAAVKGDDIAPVVAAGNDATATRFWAPSCLNSTYVVGATDDWDHIASYSNQHSYLSFFAPGGSAGTGNGIKTSAFSGYAETFGTSMAAPHVSGSFALLRQRHPTKSVGLLYNYLRNTGILILLPDGTFVPRINVDAALNEP